MINEITMLRANIMGGMNEYIKELGDEVIYMKWIMIFPDEATEDDLIEMAEDEEIWLDVVKCFARCLEVAQKGGN